MEHGKIIQFPKLNKKTKSYCKVDKSRAPIPIDFNQDLWIRTREMFTFINDIMLRLKNGQSVEDLDKLIETLINKGVMLEYQHNTGKTINGPWIS